MHLSNDRAAPDRVAFIWAIAITGLAVIGRSALNPLLGARYPFGTFYAAVALIGWFWGVKPAALSAVVGYLLGASLYLVPRDPHSSFAVDPIELIAYITICGTLIALVYRVYERQQRLDAALAAHASTRAALASSDVDLALSERRYRSVSEAFEFGMWSADAAGRLTFVSPQFLEFLGTTPDAASRQWWSAIAASPDELERAQARWKRCQFTGERWDWEYSLRGKDGTVRRIWTQAIALRSVEGIVTSWAGLNLNVTDRYDAARARDEAWQRLDLVTKVMSVGVAQCNAQREFVWMNPAYAKGIGVSPQDIERACGQRVDALLGPAAYSRLEPAFDAVLRGDTVEFEGELGTGVEPRRWIHTSLIPVWNGNAMPTGWVTVISDLSQRRALEEQLRESNRRKDDFLATLAHELRNPLAPIRYAMHLMKPGNPVEVASDARRIIDRQLAHMARLLDDLLDVSRITRGTLVIQRDLMDLRVALQHAVDAARPLAEAVEQHLDLELPDHALPVNGDETRMIQVFGNLINNAIKFTNPGGTVSISASLDEGGILARIRDTGRGIAPEFLPRVFDMFAQAEPNSRPQSGLGVGLALARQITELHEGRIEAKSDGLHRGSEFLVRLPRADEMPMMQPSDNFNVTALGAGHIRVLIVDDNVDAADALSEFLTLAGYQTRVAYDGRTAVEMAEILEPHLILLDLGLPYLSGHEVAARLRLMPWGRTARMIALTGWGQEDDKKRSFQSGFDEHLTKPVDPHCLIQRIIQLTRADPNVQSKS